MRYDPIDAERVLWQRLRYEITLEGSHFRRQALIGPFIVDFASRKARLVIELDGGQHDEQRAADERRTRYIEARGYHVLRFWNHDVLGNLDGVLQVIQSVVPPPPTPPRKGEGSISCSVSISGSGQLIVRDPMIESSELPSKPETP